MKLGKTLARLIFLILFLFLACACSVSAEKEIKAQYTIKEGHPRIYLTQAKLDDIRKRCADKKNAQFTYYAVLKNYADKFDTAKSEPSIYNCICFAFLYAIGEVPGYDYSVRSINQYGKLGVSILTQLYPPEDLGDFQRHTPMLIACYDWLFPAMVPEQRAIIYTHYTAVADKMRDLLKKTIGGRWRETREMYAFYGLAFYGDGKYIYPKDSSAANMIDKKSRNYCDFLALWWRDENVAILESTVKEGAYPAGTMYGEAPFPHKLWILDAWDTAEFYDLYNKTTSVTGYPLFWLYQMLPYRTHVRYDCANGSPDQLGGIVRFGDYRYIGYTAVANPLKVNIAQAQGVAKKNGELDLAAVFNWMIQYQAIKISPFGGPYPTDRWVGAEPNLVWDIIFRDGLVEAKSPSQAGLPLASHFGTVDTGLPGKPDFVNGRPEGGGVTVMRSSWEDPDGTLLWFKASSYPIVHDHRDQGSFQIYKKGWLAIDSGQYEETTHRGNYASRTVAHNSLLVYRPGETLNEKKVDAVWSGYANDGGQRWVGPPKTVADLSSPEYFLGGITKFESVPDVYDYAQADITRAYNSTYVTTEKHDSKVSLVERSIFFLRPDEYIVVFDRIISTKPEYPKRWLLHSVYRPELDGKESFEGLMPYSNKIPGKSAGVKLIGAKHGGISESRDTNMFAIRGWNFGPSDGRLVCRTLLPEKHITRVVGGSDSKGVHKTYLAKPYREQDGGKESAAVFVQSLSGFEVGDFVYLGPTDKPYSNGNYGRPNWPVDDVYYQGWGKIMTVDPKTNSIAMVPYGYTIPDLPEGTLIIRSDHANAKSFEFMDAEYNQWRMYGEAVANAGPFYDQHGSWRIEVESIEKKTNDVFLNVMIPCDTKTLSESQTTLKENVKIIQRDDSISLELKGKNRIFSIVFKKGSENAHIKVTEHHKSLLDNELTRNEIKARTILPKK